MDIQTYLLSAYINRQMGVRFNDFLNRHRINSCREYINRGMASDITLEALSEMCGFNNRNTFITAFKKFTGVTPSEYIRNVPQNVSQRD